jgi:hypothetical protein
MSDTNTQSSSGRVPENEQDRIDEDPQVPGFRSWRGVYIFVLAFFVAVVVLLTLFSRHYA